MAPTQQQPSFKTWQDYEMAIGCTQTVYPSSIGRQRMTAKWDPKITWNPGSDPRGSYFYRYGYYNTGAPGDMQLAQDSQLYSAGNYAGENAAGAENSPEVLAAARQLTNNPQLTLSAQDVQDMRVVADPERRGGSGEVVPLFVSRVLPLISGEKGGQGGTQQQGGDQQSGTQRAAGGAVVAGQAAGTAEILAAVGRVERAADRLEKAASALPSPTNSSPSSGTPDSRIINVVSVLEQAVKASGTGGGAPLQHLREAVSRAVSILRAG